jgi:4-hydroxyphenylpyruvate dioxygenase
MFNTETIELLNANQDILPINGTDYIELYVGNAKQSSIYYEKMFGFKITAYKGPETGCRDRVSYCLEQGKIRLVITGSLSPDSYIAEHVKLHGDGVKVIALWVDDAEKSYYETLERGAESAIPPQKTEDDNGYVITASIKTYGETIHTFVERSNYNGVFLPGFIPKKSSSYTNEVGFQYIDHCVGNVELGHMNKWVKFYEDVLGFKLIVTFDDKDISTEYTSLMSKVVSNGNGYIKFPINEPAEGIKKSQIEEYIEFYKGAGVQHVAIATNDIVATITELRKRGVEFLYVPETYYDDLFERVGDIKEDIETLKELNILVDRDEEGYLLQLFTKPIVDRPTLFFEIIQRRGAKSFGKGNFKALFESLEREQELRGNL